MTDLDCLLASILADPADDTARLVYADALQEHGNAERAEFIRIQVEIAGQRDRPQYWLGERETELLCIGLNSWVKDLAESIGVDMATNEKGKFRNFGYLSLTVGPNVFVEIKWRRGFVSTVRAPLATLRGGAACGLCCTSGGVRFPTIDRTTGRVCAHCHGSGRTVGVLAALMAANPVERVGVVPESDWLTDHGDDTFTRDYPRMRYAVNLPQEDADDPDNHWPAYMTGDIDDAREWFSDWLLAEARAEAERLDAELAALTASAAPPAS